MTTFTGCIVYCNKLKQAYWWADISTKCEHAHHPLLCVNYELCLDIFGHGGLLFFLREMRNGIHINVFFILINI